MQLRLLWAAGGLVAILAEALSNGRFIQPTLPKRILSLSMTVGYSDKWDNGKESGNYRDYRDYVRSYTGFI